MTRARRAGRPLRVLVATPSGKGGEGGIDRLMDLVFDEHDRAGDDAVRVRRLVSRGPNALASLWRTPLAAARIVLDGIFGRVDVVHINLASRGSTLRKIVLAHAARLSGVPYTVHLHGALYREYWTTAPWPLRGRIDGLFRNAARVMVLGTPWRELVTAMVPEAAPRVTVLPNATRSVADRGPRPPGRPVEILFVGRLGERKGVPQLVAALSQLSGGAPWHATIAGNGEVEATRREVRARGLAEQVSVPGWLPGPQVEACFSAADILVLPSFDENLPMSVIEGMAYGLAVVATPVGAVADIVVPEETGLLVPPGDVEALAAALDRLLADRALRERLAGNARAVQRARLSIGTYRERLVQVWADAAGGTPGPAPVEPATAPSGGSGRDARSM